MPIGQYIITARPQGFTHSEAIALAAAHHATLAAPTTDAENHYLLFILENDPLLWGPNPDGTALIGPWIGLTQQIGSTEPGGGWTWDTGEALTYSAWHPTQPDNFHFDLFGILFDYQGSIGWGDTVSDPGGEGFGAVISAAVEVGSTVRKLTGTNYHDNIRGAAVNNTIDGKGGDDRLYGGDGRDLIKGGGGSDLLLGGVNDYNDTLIGGGGKDFLYGGPGEDVFVYNKISDSRQVFHGQSADDHIFDLEVNYDFIDLSAIDAIPGGGHDKLVFAGTFFTGVGQYIITGENGHYQVLVNMKGAALPEMSITVDCDGHLTPVNFIL
ncbi:MAG: hypothetical protein ABI832_17365 [bacterium]